MTLNVQDLPIELLANVFTHIGNLDDLAAVKLTSRRFYDSVADHPTLPYHIVENQIPSALVSHALRVQDASTISELPVLNGATLESRATLEFLYNQHTAAPAERLRNLSIAQLHAVSKLAHIVDEFTMDFANSAWRLLYSDTEKFEEDPPEIEAELTGSEYFRIARAFYRIELYYVLFRGKRGHLDAGYWHALNQALFFGRLSCWEDEQLACIYEHLGRLVEDSKFVLT